MKKLLGIIGAFGLTATGSSAVVSCSMFPTNQYDVDLSGVKLMAYETNFEYKDVDKMEKNEFYKYKKAFEDYSNKITDIFAKNTQIIIIAMTGDKDITPDEAMEWIHENAMKFSLALSSNKKIMNEYMSIKPEMTKMAKELSKIISKVIEFTK